MKARLTMRRWSAQHDFLLIVLLGAVLAFLAGCAEKVEYASPATQATWRQVGEGFFVIEDTARGVACYDYRPMHGRFACVKVR